MEREGDREREREMREKETCGGVRKREWMGYRGEIVREP